MKLFLRLLRFLALGVAGLVGFLVVAALVVWLWPGLVVNGTTLPHILRNAPGVGITYRAVDGGARSVSFFRKFVWLEVDGFCVETAPLLRACGEKLAVELEVKIGRPLAFRVERAELVRGDVRVKLPASEKKAGTPEENEERSLVPKPPDFLRQVSVGRLKLDVPRVEIAWDGGDLAGSLDMSLDGETDRLGVNLGSRATLRTGKDKHALAATVDLASVGSQWYGPYVGDFAVHAKGAGRKARIDGKVHAAGAAGDALGFQLTARASEGKRRVRARIDGVGEPSRWDVTLAGAANGLVPQVPAISVEKCRFQLGNLGVRTMASQAPASLDVACGLLVTTAFLSEVAPGDNPARLKRQRFVQDILRRVPVALTVKAKVADEKTGRLDGKLSTAVEKLLRGSGQGALRADVDFSGVPTEFPKGWKATASGGVGIGDFASLVRWLHEQPWAIPEPFASLGGNLRLETSPEANLLGDQANIPLVLRTRLRSPEQALDIDGTGKIELRKKGQETRTHFGMTVTLADVRLVLPRLGLEPPPAIFPDSRIQRTVTAEGAVEELRREEEVDPAFTYDVAVATAPGKPVRLVTDLTQAPLPVTLSLRLKSGEAPQGRVHVGQTPAMFFGHRAELSRIDVKLGRASELTEINAEVRIFYTDYTVRVLVTGLAIEPKVKYLSEPPLPEEQVLAVLLFGKKMEFLDRDQARSASNLQSGIADGAVTLASMYLLASTPVESIGYDPGTRIFSAKIRLANGTSLNVGTSSEQLRQVGLRHRLGPNWAVTTYLSNPLDPLTRSLTAFLEWSRGY